MKDLRCLETDVLIDMLARLTAQYTDKLAEMNTVEINQFEYEIALIQAEIRSRVKTQMPQSETKRIFSKIKSILPVWSRYLVTSRHSKRNREKPGFT